VNNKADLFKRLRAEAELRRALVERAAQRKSRPGSGASDVLDRLKASHQVLRVARRFVD
jgi:hypothetical protein